MPTEVDFPFPPNQEPNKTTKCTSSNKNGMTNSLKICKELPEVIKDRFKNELSTVKNLQQDSIQTFKTSTQVATKSSKSDAELSAKEQESQRKFKEKMDKIRKLPPSINVTSDGLTEAKLSKKDKKNKKFQDLTNRFRISTIKLMFGESYSEPNLEKPKSYAKNFEEIRKSSLKLMFGESYFEPEPTRNVLKAKRLPEYDYKITNIIPNLYSMSNQAKKLVGDFNKKVKTGKEQLIANCETLTRHENPHPQQLLKYPNVFGPTQPYYSYKNPLMWRNCFLLLFTCFPAVYSLYKLSTLSDLSAKIIINDPSSRQKAIDKN